MRRPADEFVTARGRALRAVAVAVLLVTSVTIPAPAARADHGTCNSYRSYLGAIREGGGGYGSRATLEWDHAGVCSGYTYSWSITWTMSSYWDPDPYYDKWIQTGWSNDVGQSSTRVFYQYKDANNNVWNDFFANDYGTGLVTFATYRNWLYSTNVWCFSASGREFACTQHNMTWPKERVEFAAETNRSTNRLYGTPSDRVTLNNFGYRDGNKVWHSTTAKCVRHSYFGNDPLFSHYRGCSPVGTVVEGFDIYDDRR